MSSSLRVMHVVLSLSPGGAERLVVDLSRRLAPGVPVSICCLDLGGAWAAEAEAAGIPVMSLGRKPGFHPGLGRRIAALASRQGATVLHCHQYSPFVYGSIAGLLRPGLRVVFTEHGRVSEAGPSEKRKWVNRVLGLRPNQIVAVSNELRGHMIAEGFSPARVAVIHNGIEPGELVTSSSVNRARQLLGVPASIRVVGTVARLDPIKRLDLLIEAFANVTRVVPHLRLAVVGDGPDRHRLERLAADRGVLESVVFTGTHAHARELMPAFDVYVNSSASEGVSLTVLEAMAASRPIVATRVGGTPEVLQHDVSGILVPAGESRPIGDAIIGLLGDDERRATLGLAAHARVVGHFSLERMAQEYLAVYTGGAAR